MSNLQLDENRSVNLIKAYTPGKLIIQDTTYTQSLIITPTKIILDFAPSTINELTAADLRQLIAYQPSIILLGTGKDMTYLTPAFYGDIINAGIGFEFMSTDAACRTYNALAAENRHVLAALVIE